MAKKPAPKEYPLSDELFEEIKAIDQLRWLIANADDPDVRKLEVEKNTKLTAEWCEKAAAAGLPVYDPAKFNVDYKKRCLVEIPPAPPKKGAADATA